MTDKEILEAYKDAIRRAEVPVVHYWNSYPVEGRWVITAQGGWPNDILAAGVAIGDWPTPGDTILDAAAERLGVCRGWIRRFAHEFVTHPHTITAEEGPVWVAQALHVWLEEELPDLLVCDDV